jgi:hypothetical protein
MMSQLRVRINKYVGGDPDLPPWVYAKVYALGKNGRRVAGTVTRQELVPITDRKDLCGAMKVEPGHYYVEIVLPSGEILAEDIFVREGKIEELVLEGDRSAHEWLSWQHLAGNVPAPLMVIPGRARGESRFKRPPVREARLNELLFLSGSDQVLRRTDDIDGSVWGLLNRLSRATTRTQRSLIKELNSGKDPLVCPPDSSDETQSVFRLSLDKSGGKAMLLETPLSPTRHHYAIVLRRGSFELISLPLPWTVVSTRRQAEIEIAVQEPSHPGGFCASTVARDEELGMMLAYLSSGALPAARQLAESAREMLFYKMTNPFAAAAGGYALVGTASEGGEREWHRWVRNLMNRFEHIPDGAILWGQLRIRMRRSDSDVHEAREAFKRGYRRGVPFFSMGMRWLLDGLELVSRDDREAAHMLENVRRLAWRTNFQQAFTILRLGGEDNV